MSVMINCKNKFIKFYSYLIIGMIALAAFVEFSTRQAFAKEIKDEFSHRMLINEEKELIKGMTFNVAYNSDHKPFQYTDSSGKANGTIIAMLNKLAEKYKFKINYEVYDDLKAVNSYYDIIIATVADLYKINRNYRSTISYHEESMMMIFPKNINLPELRNNKNIIGVLNYLVDLTDLNKDFPESYFKKFDTSAELIKAYDAGTVDAAMFSRTLLDASMLGEMAFVREYYNKQNTMITSEVDISQRFYILNDLASQFLPIFNIMLSEIDYSSTLLHDATPHMQAMSFVAPTKIRLDLIISVIIITILVILALYQYTVYRKKQKQHSLVIDKKTNILSIDDFTREVEKKISHIEAGKYRLIGIDIDLFRLITAYYGAETAENLIQKMAHLLKENLVGEEAIITRYSKDYFLIFKRSYDDGQEFKNFVDNVLTPTFKEITGEHYALSFSVGMYVVNDLTIPLSDMITFSELARRQGKNIHTNTYYTFDEVMNKQYHDKLNITYRMNSALENNEFIVELQPKINIETRKIVGAEALVRWHPPKEDKIYPNDFIPIFEKNGFISKLDIYVFEKICKFIKENSNSLNDIKIAVNFSPYTLANPQIVKEIVGLTKKYNVSPSKIEIEVVESVIDDMPIADLIQRVNNFKQHGFSIALDDFGAGASSLNRFGLLPIDVIKFDKNFIDNIDNERIASTVKNFIANSKELKLITVAEGIETKEQLKIMEEAQCDIAQGYLFSKSISKEEFLEKIKANLLYLM